MEEYKIQIIQSAITVGFLFVIVRLLQHLAVRAGSRFAYQKARIKIVKKVLSVVFYTIMIGILFLIWGIAPAQLAAYMASLLTVMGIAFFAQWSIISNITSTLIIFFNHQVNIGDSVEVLDKDYQIAGKVNDIGIFFIIIKTPENDYISLPSNVFMQKMVKKVESPQKIG